MGDTVLYERRDEIGFITLNRPEAANAQNRRLTYDLDEAFTAFARDDEARVAVLRGAGKHFSAGHDTRPSGDDGGERRPVTLWWDHRGKEITGEGLLAFEEELYLGMCRRWRELPKPTIAAVAGACIGGGLSLAWSCDLILASDDAFFADPVVSMGCPGIEFFCHPWVLGPRLAKEFLYTGERMPAQRAYEIGMVNRVVPRAELDAAATALATRIAERPRYALALTKKAVNACEDEMGLRSGMETSFALHQLSHAHNTNISGFPVLVTDPAKLKTASQ
ncbi:enoyl-CoA hydratase [Frankia sp. AgB32]|uniref:enoyl-CoA hydratase n=1 Tax=Frankia sp. AgB32 TaxID=631119 RepID=UPI00200D811F|nr:enoyl-CoA hydratase [Frankia sp. AgB32]MCK9896329.1 enoyl-CoA hydratase [Frankia sp. AgB32]